MIDMRTKFFALAGLISFFLSLAAPKDLQFVPIWLGIIYVVLTILCGLDSMSRNSKSTK